MKSFELLVHEAYTLHSDNRRSEPWWKSAYLDNTTFNMKRSALIRVKDFLTVDGEQHSVKCSILFKFLWLLSLQYQDPFARPQIRNLYCSFISYLIFFSEQVLTCQHVDYSFNVLQASNSLSKSTHLRHTLQSFGPSKNKSKN